MNTFTKYALALAGLAAAAHAVAEITFYENDGFGGRSFSAESRVDNFKRQGFNDRASSLIVSGSRWEVCSDAGFGGRCVVLRPGQYASLSAMGLNDRISSARAIGAYASVGEDRYGPPPVVEHDYRRRHGERLYQANVLEVRAVVGPPEQRCWVEREQVPGRDNAVPAGIAGAVIGGILGHQIGGGSGRDLATVGGAIGGAAIGARVGRNHGTDPETRDVQRCAEVSSQARADFWDVTYDFRGQVHHVQMTAPPGATVTVNRDGEPRVG